MKARAEYLNHDGSTLLWHLSQQTNDPVIGELETGRTLSLPRYSIDWSLGGPLVEQEKIATVYRAGEYWLSYTFDGAEFEGTGPTPLIAAMRCYVASKLGEEIEIPEELR
jgi:hypothetical protein